jgi:hypothetical protein
MINPFAYYIAAGHPGSTSITVSPSLDMNGNTEIIFQGPPIPLGFHFAPPNSGNGQPHLGLDVGTPPPGGYPVVSEAWSFSGGGSAALPALSAYVTPAPGTTGKFVAIFAEAQFAGVTVGTWFEFPLLAGASPTISISNNSSSPLTLSDVGFLISPTEIPLDQLNFQDFPPPDQPGSPFTPLRAFDGRSLSPGDSVSAALPEPLSVVSLALGVACLALRSAARAARRGGASPVT